MKISNETTRGVAAMKAMFAEMVEDKNAELIEHFYDPGFVMHSNGRRQDFESFATAHRKVYATDISYRVEYDEEAWIDEVDDAGTGKVAGRLWIATSLPDQEPKRLEVILIAAYLRDKIRTLWELTYPNWADLDAFSDYETE